MSTPGAEAQFRRWLVHKLTLTRWPVRKGESIEALAARLLVHPEALRLAEKELAAGHRQSGRSRMHYGRVIGGYREDIRHRIDLAVHPEVHRAIHSYCRVRGTTPGVLMRSLIHSFLSEARNPERHHRWILDGRSYVISRGGRGAKFKRQPVIKTDVTAGAYRALVFRAREAGTTIAELVRGALIEALQGKRLDFEIVTRTGQMWDDETRYVTKV